MRQLHGTLSLTVLPVASGFIARGDDERLQDLLLRGTRYVMAVVVPVTVVTRVRCSPETSYSYSAMSPLGSVT